MVLSNPIFSIYLHIEHKIFPMKKIIFFAILTSVSFVFSQSKKEQIEILTNRVDSLKNLLSSERNTNAQKISGLENTISQLNQKITGFETQIASLNTQVSRLSADLQSSKTETASKQQELNIKQQELNTLNAQLQSKTDSLEIVRAELEKLKPAPKPVVTNSTNQVTQTGSYKSVKIGTQTWMTENLNVSTFRNGDPIPQVKSNEEWKQAGENKQPAWCYYENDPKNGNKYGKLYNWYAVNDPRGLAPAGWHIPTDAEWTTLENHLGDDAGKKMKSASGWNGYGCKKCDGGSSEFKKICSACKGTQSNSSEPNSGNGTNSSGFSGLPGGFRDYYGNFSYVGYYGYWWSASEGSTFFAYSRSLDSYYRNLSRNYDAKGKGWSVRCLRD